MCIYKSKNELKKSKKNFLNWINKVQKQIKKEYKIHFSYNPIGSGKRNMVIKQCNRNYFDLDYQIVITKIPKSMNYDKDAKEIKNIFRNTFDNYKPSNFKCCEDSTQALTTKNNVEGYGYDIIITRYDEDNNFYILYNKKNTNDANNEDYYWAIRSEMKDYKKRYNKIKAPEMWKYLRDIYNEKRHNHKDDVEPNKKKSYQILNEAVNETLKHFNK